MPSLTNRYSTMDPKGPLTLEKSGKPLTLELRLNPKLQPIEVKPGEGFELTLNLSNDLSTRFRTTVKESEGPEGSA